MGYKLWDSLGNGDIWGSQGDDTLSVLELAAFSSANKNVYVTVSGKAGDDTLIGHAGGNWLSGGVGNDTLIGLEGVDTAGYTLTAAESAGELFYYQSADSVIVSNLNGDLYQISLSQDGSGQVIDLHTDDRDEGTDQLYSMERVVIRDRYTQERLTFELNVSGQYNVNGKNLTFVQNSSADSTSNELSFDGRGKLYGSNQSDLMEASVFSPYFLVMNGFAGDDHLIGNDSTNILRGDEGDDQLEGAGGEDIALYMLHSLEVVGALSFTQSSDQIIVHDAEKELYAVTLSADGSGQVSDLFTSLRNEGVDSLSGIELVQILLSKGDDYLEISRESNGSYKVTGPRLLDYQLWDDQGNGDVWGTDYAETIDLSELSIFDTSNNSSSYISLSGKGGDDHILGHDGGNWLEGGAGNDLLEGKGGFDTAGYKIAISEHAGRLNYRFVDDKVVVASGGSDLYQVELGATGLGRVVDLYTTGFDEGTDLLQSMERVSIRDSQTNENVKIEISGSGDYSISGSALFVA